MKVLRDWEDLSILHRNRLKSRAYFIPYKDDKSALTFERGNSDSFKLLNGIWKFSYSETPGEAPEAFYSNEYDDSNWNDIPVPSHWQLHGYGHPHYTDLIYPFPIDPPNVPSDNPTGSYRTSFTIPRSWYEKEVILRFEGVDSAFHLWVNGSEVGYSQGSRMPSEFDITKYLREGKNTLSVRVYQWSDGSYIEDQDMWWMSGIFRDVSLIARNPVSVADFFIKTDLDKDYQDGRLKIETSIGNSLKNKIDNYKISYSLLDGHFEIVCEDEVNVSLKGMSEETFHSDISVSKPKKNGRLKPLISMYY